MINIGNNYFEFMEELISQSLFDAFGTFNLPIKTNHSLKSIYLGVCDHQAPVSVIF